MSSTIKINDIMVPVEYKNSTQETLEVILKEPKVVDYFARIDPIIVPTKVNILSHKMLSKGVGFVWMDIESTHKYSGKKLAGGVFLRGGSVACLILIKNKETSRLHYIKLVQTRVPCGKEIEEICAGMLDRDIGMMSGAMVKEIEEETGIKVHSTGTKSDVPTTQYNYLEELGDFIPSGGGCDEIITTFWYMTEMSTSEIDSMQGRLINHGDKTTEYIKVVIEDFNALNVAKTRDAKAMCSTLQLMARYPGFVPN